MVAVLVSVGIVAAGLWLTMSENASDMGILGAMLLVLGPTFLGPTCTGTSTVSG